MPSAVEVIGMRLLTATHRLEEDRARRSRERRSQTGMKAVVVASSGMDVVAQTDAARSRQSRATFRSRGPRTSPPSM